MRIITLVLINFMSFAVLAEPLSDDATNSLKIEANHNLNRLKNYRTEKKNNEVFDREREGAVTEFLEEQEVWELLRERGLKDYIKLKKKTGLAERSKEYKEDQKSKKKQQGEYEKSRKDYVRAKDKVRRESVSDYVKLESKEYEDLYAQRPRYDLKKRKSNKYIGSTKPGTGSLPSSSYNPDSYLPSAPTAADYPPAPEFPPAPAPYEGYDDIPPPPIFDGANGNVVPYDAGYGSDLIPPPPPPPPDYDF